MRSKHLSKPARPTRVDPFVTLIQAHLEKLFETTTLREMGEQTWVAPSTLSKYKNGHGRNIRSDTLRGILKIFNLKVRIG